MEKIYFIKMQAITSAIFNNHTKESDLSDLYILIGKLRFFVDAAKTFVG